MIETPGGLKRLESGDYVAPAFYEADSAFNTLVDRVEDAVPNTRTVNGKALAANITLTPADVGAVAAEGQERYALPLNDGYTRVNNNQAYYMKNAFGEVTIGFTIKKTDGSDIIGAYVAVLPVGFRPSASIDGPMTGSNGASRTAGVVNVESNGRMAVYPADTASAKTVTGLICYLAEG